MKHLLLLPFLLLGFLLFSQDKSIDNELQHFLNDEAVKHAPLSIYVANSLTGGALLETNAQLSITPASILKLITSATALEKLGSNYRFTTTIGYKGEIVNRTLVGDLIVIGGGDPTLGSSYFNKKSQKKSFLSKWAHFIKESGIDSITGNIVVDPYIYSDNDVPQTWIWEDLGNYFGAAAQGVAIYDNTFKLVLKRKTLKEEPPKLSTPSPSFPT